MLPEVLIPEDAIASRVRELAERVSADYAGKDLVLIGVLKGAFIFLADLMRQLSIPVTVDFTILSSYGASTESSGSIRILREPEERVQGRHVLIVEDIVDTGLTLHSSGLVEKLHEDGAADVRVCTLLDKPGRRRAAVRLDYVGFEVPDEFVVGYGLDFDGLYRNLPFIGVIHSWDSPPNLESK